MNANRSEEVVTGEFPAGTAMAGAASPSNENEVGAAVAIDQAASTCVGVPSTETIVQELAVPSVIGDYELVERLGAGGMGTVYKARHRRLKRLVAIKCVKDVQTVQRFLREMEAVGQLSHPNIVSATDAREVAGQHILVMEYVEGADLARLSRQHGPLSPADACELIRQASLALQHAHEHHLVHRDIKPANLILTPTGTVKLLDLGLARFVAPTAADTAEPLTEAGAIVGTVDYLAPEQAEGRTAVDIRADLYSLGCTLFHLLTGHPPYADQPRSLVQKLWAHTHEPFPSIRALRPDLPAPLVQIVERLTAKDPRQRYQTPKELAAAIAPFAIGANLPVLLGGPTFNTNQPQAEIATADLGLAETATLSRLKRPRRRIRWLALSAVAALALVGAYFGFRPGPAPSSPSDTTPFPIAAATAPVAMAPTVPVPPAPSGDALRVVKFAVYGWRYHNDRIQSELGELGVQSTAVQVGDDLRIQLQLSRTAYAYVAALDANGTIELQWPESGQRAPPPLASVELPTNKLENFHLEEGTGTQAFVLIAAAAPLPAFDAWAGKKILSGWHRDEEAAGVWRYAAGQLQPLELAGPRANRGRKRRGPEALQLLCAALEQLPGITAVEAVAFPVVADK